jgi:Flp pilus assembly protein CpaB
MALTAGTYPAATEAGNQSINHARAIFGLVVALIGAALVLFLYVHGQPRSVEVLKAARDLPPGAVLQSEDLVAETEPLSDDLAALVVPAAERDSVVGHPLSNGLTQGLPLARAQVQDTGQRIPEDLRVVAFPVTPETAAGGRIVPGNDVEILATLDKTQGDQAHTITVVDRVTVYDIGSPTQSNGLGTADRGSTGSKPLSWLSVLANADQARAIATAVNTGELEVDLLPPLRPDPSTNPQVPSAS